MPAFNSILTALGWSLLNSIWQMALLWVVFYLLSETNKRISATGKHNLALVFAFLGSEWFVYSFLQLLRHPFILHSPGFIPLSVLADQYISYLGILYLLITVCKTVKYSYDNVGRNKIRSGDSELPALQAFADRWVRLLGITRRVEILLSLHETSAATSGFLKPLILLPVSLVTNLSAQQVESILVHELFHIRRNDYLINICISCFRSIFFFNPFARLFYESVARERELACDDGVIEMGYPPLVYAEALYKLEKFRQVHPGFTLAADGHNTWFLMERIRRMLGKSTTVKRRTSGIVILGGLAGLLTFGMYSNSSLTDQSVITSARELDFTPVHFKLVTETSKESQKKSVGVAVNRKEFKRKTLRKTGLQQNSETINSETADPTSQSFFAENNIIRNFSNQQGAAPVQDAVNGFSGAPFVPTVSLSYEALPEIMSADSLHRAEMLNGLKNMMTASRIRTIVRLKVVAAENENNLKQLREIEIYNRKMIMLDRKNMRPLLEKMYRLIQLKKNEIDRLQLKLRISEEEIIHI